MFSVKFAKFLRTPPVAASVYKIIKNLDPDKVHDHEIISILMLKLSSISICKPFELLFQTCLRSSKFPSKWKKANVVHVDTQCIKNYCPVFLLLVWGKVFEWLLIPTRFHFFLKIIWSVQQSEFRPGDSCNSQLLLLKTHEILSAFDDYHEFRGVFLDISKAFDRKYIWHKGLLFKLQQKGVLGELITLIKDFSDCKKQRFVLNGQHWSWADVKPGVSQGSILGPSLFSIYLNDLLNGFNSDAKLFAIEQRFFWNKPMDSRTENEF